MDTDNILMNTMGFKTYEKKVQNSVERYDFDEGTIYKDYIQAQEELDFIDTFELINKSNVNAKLKMLSKINKEYGNCNRGIENYCRIQSLEAENEVEGNTAKADSGDEAKPAEQPKEITEKKLKWYQTVWNAIKKFFAKIRDFFKMIWNKITGIFKKNKDVSESIDQADSSKENELEKYLDTAEIPVDKDFDGFIIINDDLLNKLKSEADRYLKLCTLFDSSVRELTEAKKTDSVEKFIEMGKVYFAGSDNEGSVKSNGDDNAKFDSLNKALGTLAKRKYDREHDLKRFGGQLTKNKTIKSIIGTSNAKKAKGIISKTTQVINDFNTTIDKAEKLAKSASTQFEKYINDKKNEDVKNGIDSICVNMFKAITNVANINVKLAQDISKSTGKVSQILFGDGVKKILGVVGSTAIKFVGGMKKLSKSGREKVSKLIQSGKQMFQDELNKKQFRDVNAALMSRSIQELIENISKAYVNDSSYYSKDYNDFKIDVVNAISDNGYFDMIKEKFGNVNANEVKTIMGEINENKLRDAYNKVKTKQMAINQAERNDIQNNLREKENRQ